jgi:soluble lytic murein transglycosylase-like protein
MLYVLLSSFMGVAQTETAPIQKLTNEVAIQYGLDAELFSAIIAQESSFRVSAYNRKTQDYGLGQINIKNVKALKLDKKRLLTDARYNLEVSAKILSQMQKRYAHKEPSSWYCRYNVGTGKLGATRTKNCIKYANLINNKLQKLTVAVRD